MIQARCPTCGKSTSGATLADLPHFPFCSPRCRLIDLGRWADEAHVIPVQQKPADDESADEDED